MKGSTEFEHFIQVVVSMSLSVTDKAVACLWYANHYEAGCAKTAGELANQMHATGLTGTVNVSRLGNGLRASRYTVRGTRRNSFKILLARRPELDKHYLALLKSRKVEVSDDLLPDTILKGTREYLERLGGQINGCHQFGFYDACAVVCRRMVESLLIEAFDKAGHLAAIQDSGGNLLGLDEIMRKAESRQYISLGRTTMNNLKKIKEIGDTAAHDRYHITTEPDIAEFRPGFRKVISELLALGGITASK